MPYDPLISAKAELDKLCLDIAKDIAKEAGATSPVDTGRLSRSYEGRQAPEGAEVTSSAPYWLYVEYGTSRQSAQPHVRPAIEVVRNDRR